MSQAVLYQAKAPDERVAALRQLLANVIILRLRRPADPKVAELERDVRARIRAERSLPPPKPRPAGAGSARIARHSAGSAVPQEEAAVSNSWKPE